MLDYLTSYHFFSSLGLILDIIGVAILFYSHGIILVSGAVLSTKRQKIGFLILIVGFLLQLISSIWSYFC